MLRERQTASQIRARGQPTAGMAGSLRSRCLGIPWVAQTLQTAQQQLRAAEDACVLGDNGEAWPQICLCSEGL